MENQVSGFRKDKTTAAQTSANVAGGVVTALITAGSPLVTTLAEIDTALVKLTTAVLGVLGPIVDGDNALFASVEQADAKSGTGASTSAAKKGGEAHPDDPGDIELRSGKFKGCTIREVFEMDAETAGAKYSHRAGEGGDSYITWLSTAKNPNDFTRGKALAFIEAVG